jgi:hypothetical protein
MNTPRLAFVTPSYSKDRDRCALLVESMDRFVPARHRHYLVVPRRDLRSFTPLRSQRTEVMAQEEVLPAWLRQIGVAPKWWLSLRSAPVRGWIVQQIVKLAAAQAIRADAYACIDSGNLFVRAFDPLARHLRDGRLLLFREQGPQFTTGPNQAWHATAARLLGLPARPSWDRSYVSLIVYFWRDVLLGLQERIAAAGGGDWRVAIARLATFSEYVLHGLYCDEVLGEGAAMYHGDTLFAHCHWTTERLDEVGLARFREAMAEDRFLVMINEKSGTPLELIRRTFLGP